MATYSNNTTMCFDSLVNTTGTFTGLTTGAYVNSGFTVAAGKWLLLQQIHCVSDGVPIVNGNGVNIVQQFIASTPAGTAPDYGLFKKYSLSANDPGGGTFPAGVAFVFQPNVWMAPGQALRFWSQGTNYGANSVGYRVIGAYWKNTP